MCMVVISPALRIFNNIHKYCDTKKDPVEVVGLNEIIFISRMFVVKDTVHSKS